jgi:uncharacterized membrane protein YfcA
MATIVLTLAFGLLIGLLLGVVGGGGSILTVPILVYVIGEGVHQATATSLVIVGLTAAFGAIPHFRAGRVELPIAIVFGAAGIAGAFAGAWANQRASGPVILLLFGLVMLVVAARMAFAKRPRPRTGRVDAATGWRMSPAVPAAGLVVGLMTGFFGVGGGFLIVPALVLALGMTMKLAVGTSLVIIAINSAAGVAAHLGVGGFDWPVALFFVVGGFVGATVGGRLAGRLDEARLSRGFAALVALVGVYLIVRNGMLLA